MMKVDRRYNLSTEDFQKEYLDLQKPVVISNEVPEWTAIDKWTPSYLNEKIGMKEVSIEGRKCKFSDFIDNVVSSTIESPSHYLIGRNIFREFPELLDDIQPRLRYSEPNHLTGYFGKSLFGHSQGIAELIIGGKGGRFPHLHYDYLHMHAFVVQIEGDKEFTIYHPDQTEYLYPKNEGESNISRILDVSNVDYLKYSKFRLARSQKIIVRKGEIIFLPSGWWHTTRLLSLSIAVTLNSVTDNILNIVTNDAEVLGRKRTIQSRD